MNLNKNSQSIDNHLKEELNEEIAIVINSYIYGLFIQSRVFNKILLSIFNLYESLILDL